MKYKTTRKAVVNGYPVVKSAGYCDLQELLRYHEPVAYTAGVYGWNFDVYDVYGLAICTGYRGFPNPMCEGIREYEEKAAAINHWENKATREEKKAAVEKLLQDFCRLNGGFVS